MTATSDAAKAMAEAYDASLDVEAWDMHRVWVETLAAIPTDVLARVVAERPDGPTPLFEGKVVSLYGDNRGVMVAADEAIRTGRYWSELAGQRVVVLAAPTEDSDHE